MNIKKAMRKVLKKTPRKYLPWLIIFLLVIVYPLYVYNTPSLHNSNPINKQIVLSIDKMLGKKPVNISDSNNQAYLDLKWDGTISGINLPINNEVADFNDNELNEDLNSGTWLKVNHLDENGRTLEANALLSHQGVVETKKVKRPSFTPADNPSGWKLNAHYDSYNQEWTGGKGNNRQISINGSKDWLYNRSHQVGWQLGGGYKYNNSNSNGWENNMRVQNLITGTRNQNAPSGMLSIESTLADYLLNHDKLHIRYRVTPIYNGDDLIARGSHVMAESVEDKGKTISINEYIFNNEVGVDINYQNGTSTGNGKK